MLNLHNAAVQGQSNNYSPAPQHDLHMSTMPLWMGRWTQTFKIQVTLHESGEGNINDISFLLFLYSDKITFPSC